jgi:hypothetical protein
MQVITDSGEKVFSELCSDASEINHEHASKWSSLFKTCFVGHALFQLRQ